MANRRMFAQAVVMSDTFLDMPASTRCLYYSFGVTADDDGFVSNPHSIMRQCMATIDDLKLLIDKNYVIPFESGIIAITHWLLNNRIRHDRYCETIFLSEKSQLMTSIDQKYFLPEPPSTIGIPIGVPMVTPVKVSPGQISPSQINADEARLCTDAEEDFQLCCKYGTYQNVMLSDKELSELKSEFPDWHDRIERLSEYIASTGKSYKNHLATIRIWAKRDSEQQRKKNAGQDLDDPLPY